eukprot:scaffold319262_cov31-Tisochrysis_lutea.AAC.2
MGTTARTHSQMSSPSTHRGLSELSCQRPSSTLENARPPSALSSRVSAKDCVHWWRGMNPICRAFGEHEWLSIEARAKSAWYRGAPAEGIPSSMPLKAATCTSRALESRESSPAIGQVVPFPSIDLRAMASTRGATLLACISAVAATTPRRTTAHANSAATSHASPTDPSCECFVVPADDVEICDRAKGLSTISGEPASISRVAKHPRPFEVSRTSSNEKGGRVPRESGGTHICERRRERTLSASLAVKPVAGSHFTKCLVSRLGRWSLTQEHRSMSSIATQACG